MRNAEESHYPMRSTTGAIVAAALLAAGCAHVPGETLLGGSLKREVRNEVLELARNQRPECRQQTITNTEVVDVHGDGKVAAERWTVDQCGSRVYFIVSLPRDVRGSQRFFVRRAR